MVETASGQTATLKGSALVLGILLLAAGLGAFAVWFQWGQTRRCLAFLGPVAARRIQLAPQVELWMLAADGTTIRAIERLDVSQAPGLVHLRRGLIEDVNYRWEEPVSAGAEPPLSPSSWDVAFAFLILERPTGLRMEAADSSRAPRPSWPSISMMAVL